MGINDKEWHKNMGWEEMGNYFRESEKDWKLWKGMRMNEKKLSFSWMSGNERRRMVENSIVWDWTIYSRK